jgi:hypothetical protein
MTRVRSSTFQGATPFEVDVDALTLGRTLQNACGDVALVYDKITGENAEPLPVNHTGPGRGSVLGVPLWNQYIGRSINYVGSGTSKGGIPAPIYLLAHPFHLPRGESTLSVRLNTEGGNLAALRPTVRVTSTTGTTRQVAVMDVADGVASARLTGMTEGENIVFVEANTQGSSLTDLLLLSWHGYFDRVRRASSTPRAPSGSTAVGVTTPGASEALSHTNIDSNWLSSGAAFDGFITSHLDRNINGLLEFGSGWPAGGNASYTHEDQSGGVADPTDPSQSRFHAATRTLLANEGQIDFPVWCEAFGAMGADGVAVAAVGGTAPTAGMLQWFAPYPVTAALSILTQLLIRYPDFQTASSRLRAVILVGTNEPANVTSWTGTINTTTGSSGAVFAAPFNVDTSTGSPLSIASPTAIPFQGDGITLTSLQTSKGAALSGTYEELFLLGVCMYFEGT